ncbi:MAG: hypothetical protein WCV90_00200 [Candidatus Woesearchaeota archaeon]|jgi:hypothetical protein
MTYLDTPVYLNLFELTQGDHHLGRLELSLDQWYQIPTTYDTNQRGGRLFLPHVPGKNVRIDLEYGAKIKTINEFNDGSSVVSYPLQNPLFHKRLLHYSDESHYTFQTAYPPRDFRPGSLSKAVKLTRSNASIKKRQKEVDPEFVQEIIAGSDDLELILSNLFKFVSERSNQQVNKNNDYSDFLVRYREIETEGSFKGSCKEISTITAGLVNALGLRSRRLSGSVHVITDKEDDPSVSGHSFAEVYVPLDRKHGFWLLVDPAMDNLYNSRRFLHEKDVYTLDAALPLFSDTTKSARIKVRYV